MKSRFLALACLLVLSPAVAQQRPQYNGFVQQAPPYLYDSSDNVITQSGDRDPWKRAGAPYPPELGTVMMPVVYVERPTSALEMRVSDEERVNLALPNGRPVTVAIFEEDGCLIVVRVRR
jgi:hypothetical protein